MVHNVKEQPNMGPDSNDLNIFPVRLYRQPVSIGAFPYGDFPAADCMP